MRRRIGYTFAWLVAVALAITVGVAAVSQVGASIRGRGPVGGEVDIQAIEDRPTTPPPGTPARSRTVSGEFGEFVVECRGVYAYGVEARPDEEAGWAVVSYEPGPDDDVDAVFSNAGRSAELEVFCARGEPTVAEIEFNALPPG